MFTGELAVKFNRLVQMIVAPTQGLSRLFTVKPGGIFAADSVQYDIMQEAEAMALPRKRGDEPNKNTGSTFQTVHETPVYITEEAPLNVMDLKGRFPGIDKYSDADTALVTKLFAYMASLFAQIQRKIDRQVEWQASEILQRGELDYTVFTSLVPQPLSTISFLMNAAMFPTTAITWNTATGDQMRDDLIALGDEIRKRGKKIPTDVILGRASNRNYWGAADNLALLDNRRTEIGMRAPEALRADGFALEGEMKVGPYMLRFWTYEGWYKHPVTGVLTSYIDTNSAIMFSENGERDRIHAGVDIVMPTDAEAFAMLPGISGLDQIATRTAVESQSWAYTDAKKKTTTIGIDTAPLLVPINRAGHGCLDTLST